MRTMKSWAVVCVMAMMTMGAAAQTNVTTSGGTANTVPVFTTGSNVENSVITQSGGNVGIGTTSPLSGLSVFSWDNEAAGGIRFGGSGTSDAFLGFAYLNPPGNDVLRISKFDHGTNNNRVDFLTINANNGNVGIGTTSPYQKLSISSGSLDFDNFGFLSSYRGPANNYTNLFLGGSIVDNGNGNYTVETDGGSNYFAAIRMDNSGGNAGAINFYTAPAISGSTYNLTNAQLAGYQRMTIVGSNVGIGTTSPSARLEVDGGVKLTGGSGGSITFADGSVQSTAYTGVTCGGDYAESVDVTGERKQYEPGDVLVIDPDHAGKFLKSAEAYSTMVAGIYSTRPGLVGRRQTSDKSHMKDEVPMAMVGIVPTKVSAENGAIHAGDLLVTSSKLGYAMKGTDRSRMLGAVVGKALGTLNQGTGEMEVLVTLQ